MTHDERAAWIRRVFILLLAIGIGVGVWFYPKSQPPVVVAANPEVKPDLVIIHFYQPDDANSATIAGILDKVFKKYNGQVEVRSVDVIAEPSHLVAEQMTQSTKVVMMTDAGRVCEFQGLWSALQIERKIDQILRGLKRVGKDWRPEVHGMTPANPAASGKRPQSTEPGS